MAGNAIGCLRHLLRPVVPTRTRFRWARTAPPRITDRATPLAVPPLRTQTFTSSNPFARSNYQYLLRVSAAEALRKQGTGRNCALCRVSSSGDVPNCLTVRARPSEFMTTTDTDQTIAGPALPGDRDRQFSAA
jgi:hypothetical protein